MKRFFDVLLIIQRRNSQIFYKQIKTKYKMKIDKLHALVSTL